MSVENQNLASAEAPERSSLVESVDNVQAEFQANVLVTPKDSEQQSAVVMQSSAVESVSFSQEITASQSHKELSDLEKSTAKSHQSSVQSAKVMESSAVESASSAQEITADQSDQSDLEKSTLKSSDVCTINNVSLGQTLADMQSSAVEFAFVIHVELVDDVEINDQSFEEQSIEKSTVKSHSSSSNNKSDNETAVDEQSLDDSLDLDDWSDDSFIVDDESFMPESSEQSAESSDHESSDEEQELQPPKKKIRFSSNKEE